MLRWRREASATARDRHVAGGGDSCRRPRWRH